MRIRKFIAVFIFCLCSVTAAKARLEYNSFMDWYYWWKKLNQKHTDIMKMIFTLEDIDGNGWCSVIE